MLYCSFLRENAHHRVQGHNEQAMLWPKIVSAAALMIPAVGCCRLTLDKKTSPQKLGGLKRMRRKCPSWLFRFLVVAGALLTLFIALTS